MKWAIVIIVFAHCLSASAQGTFQNLNFEDAVIVPITGQPYAVTVANALPGWTVDYGSVQQTQITYNDPSLGGTWVTLLANGFSTLTGEAPLDGNSSVMLFAGLYEGPPAAATISQTGQIPLGTQSLLFDWAGVGPQPGVFIGNDNLSLFPVGSGTSEGGVPYTIFGANVSAWGGQTEQVSFSAISSIGLLDDISFSPTSVVAEPEPLALAGVGGLLFALYRRFAPKRQ